MPTNAASIVAKTVLLSFFYLSAALAADKADKDGWIVLSDSLKHFQKPTNEWIIVGNVKLDPENKKHLVSEPGDGVLVNGAYGSSQNLTTRENWGNLELKLDFMISKHSNSGVKLEGAYEIQITDSASLAHPTGKDCGGVYPRAELKPHYRYLDDGIAPRMNAAKPAGQWQTLEIVFHAPHFDKDGKKTANARFDRVVLNGKLIHENVELQNPTGHAWVEKEHATGPLFLQSDHGPVAFRNIRLRPLSE